MLVERVKAEDLPKQNVLKWTSIVKITGTMHNGSPILPRFEMVGHLVTEYASGNNILLSELPNRLWYAMGAYAEKMGLKDIATVRA